MKRPASSLKRSREIRVFLSSTFRDMDAERDYLMKQIFPKVRAACMKRQVGFTAIDLRWGVTEEDSMNGATVEICLTEIDRCRDFPPFFIGFLGERYGWIPQHEDLIAYWRHHADSQYRASIEAAVQRGLSVTELEMELAVLVEGAADRLFDHALFLLRDRSLTDSLYQQETGHPPNVSDATYYDPAGNKLAELKARLRKTPFLGIDGYKSIEQFGQAIENYLLAQLSAFFPVACVPTDFERQLEAHAGFRFHRLDNFLPRNDQRQALLDALEAHHGTLQQGTLLLAGPSGHGKSAIMADLARHLESVPGYCVIDHYIGADANNSLDSWVNRVLETLRPCIDDIAGSVPESPQERLNALPIWLNMAANRQQCRIVLILDALDQLGDGGSDLEPLRQHHLGNATTVIASAADNTLARQSAATLKFKTFNVPALDANLRSKIIRNTLANYRKSLPANLVQRLANAPQTSSPLFLTLALEELRLDASHENLVSLIENVLAQPDAQQFFLHNFLLDEDYGRLEQPYLAADFMAILSASYAGITEHELADLLALAEDPKAPDTERPRLPQQHLSRLMATFQPFLLDKVGRRAPMHRALAEAALKHGGETQVRERLYAYFAPGYGHGWKNKNNDRFSARSAAEALYQATLLARLPGDKQGKAKQRLFDDLTQLHVLVRLKKTGNHGEEIIRGALESIQADLSDALTEHWAACITAMTDDVVVAEWESVVKFAQWLQITLAYARYLPARHLLEALLSRQEQVVNIDQTALSTTMSILGNICMVVTDNALARSLYERALAMRENALGADHPDVATSCNNLAVLLAESSNPEDRAAARSFHERALAIRERSLGSGHKDVAQSCSNLAVYLGTSGDLNDIDMARHLLERALTIRENAHGLNHPDVALVCNNLAVYLAKSSDPTDRAAARPLCERALAIWEKALGPNHPDVAMSCNNLAGYLAESSDPTDRAAARPLYERALAIREKALGPEHPDVAMICDSVALYLAATGSPADFSAARRFFGRALAILNHTEGAIGRNTLRVKQNFAVSLRDAGHLDESETLLQETLQCANAVGGENSIQTASTHSALGVLMKLKNERASAEHHFRKSLEIRERQLGSEDVLTKLVRQRLEELLSEGNI